MKEMERGIQKLELTSCGQSTTRINPTAPAVAFVESAPMSEADRERIAYKNAERIFSH